MRVRVQPEIAERLRIFAASDLFTSRSVEARSEYWKYQGAQLQANIHGTSVDISGDSGFYAPPEASLWKRAAGKVTRALQRPSNATGWIARQVRSRFAVPRLMSHEQAFNAVMSHALISDPDLSRFRVNHLRLGQRAKVFPTANAIKQHYETWSGKTGHREHHLPLLLSESPSRLCGRRRNTHCAGDRSWEWQLSIDPVPRLGSDPNDSHRSAGGSSRGDAVPAQPFPGSGSRHAARGRPPVGYLAVLISHFSLPIS
jgi:hypothetical protein